MIKFRMSSRTILRVNSIEYASYNVQYCYVVDKEKKLAGVLRIHNLLFPSRESQLSQVMISSPLSVSDKTSLKELQEFFDEHHLFGVPVIDDQQRLVGGTAECRRRGGE